MTGPAFDHILEALRQAGRPVRTEGPSRARSSCPAHDGNGLNLSIFDNGSRVNLKCFSHDCDGADIIAALDMTVRDLYHEPKEKTLARYEYGSGYWVTRELHGKKPNDGKGFKQVAGWSGRLRPLYHGERIPDAVAAGQPVYLVEGEEDVHSIEMAAPGAVAVTAPQGAGNFQHADVEPLRGADVLAIVDRDDSGKVWANTVATKLAGVAASVRFVHARTGKDATEHLTAGHTLDDLEPIDQAGPLPGDEPAERRHLTLVSAAGIRPRRVRWLWDGRFALGSMGILAGREGLGKSTVCYTFAAQVTRGTMPGEFYGQPRSVIVCATEDSWEHTIVPRLMAAGADLNLIYRVDVTSEGLPVGLSLPTDLYGLEKAAKNVAAAMLLLDPLTSRLHGKLDTHKDAEVRQALEPLVGLADRADLFVLGIMHFNKSGGTDPLSLVMGSKAFTAVARSVHSVVPDPDDDTDRRRLFGTPKNNLGTANLPSLGFEIESFGIPTDDGTAWTGKLVWTGEVETTIADAVRSAAVDSDDKHATLDAADWLDDYLTSQGGTAESASVKKAARAAGHSDRTLHRARQKLHITTSSQGFPRKTWWNLPEAADSPATGPRDHGTTGTTGTTGDDESLGDISNGTTTRGNGATDRPSSSGASCASGATETGTCPTCGGTNDADRHTLGLDCLNCHIAHMTETPEVIR